MEFDQRTASATGARSLSPGDRVSEANERLPENELQMAAILYSCSMARTGATVQKQRKQSSK